MHSTFGEMHLTKLQWYNIFLSLFLLLQCNFFPLWLRHQTSTTKLSYFIYEAPSLQGTTDLGDGFRKKFFVPPAERWL